MNEKFCPFISTDGKKRTCQQEECIFWDKKQKCCDFKKETIITVTEGCKIACGFTIWALFIATIVYVILNVIVKSAIM